MRTKIEVIVPRMTDFVVYDSSCKLKYVNMWSNTQNQRSISADPLNGDKVKLLSKGLPGGTLFSGDPDWKNFVW